MTLNLRKRSVSMLAEFALLIFVNLLVGTSGIVAFGQESGLLRAGSLEPGQERAYAYDAVDGKYPNIFREQGRTFAVMLLAHARNGKYTDDTIGIAELTDPHHVKGYDYPIQVSHDDTEFEIDVRIENRDDELWLKIIALHSKDIQTSYEARIKDIYRWRLKAAKAWTLCGHEYLQGSQGGLTHTFLFFEGNLSRYINAEPPENFRLLAPLYVVQVPSSGNAESPAIPIADTGCSMYFHSDGRLHGYPPK